MTRGLSRAVVLACVIVCSRPIHALDGLLQNKDLGLIFSTKDILFGLDEYEGGLGIKIAGDKVAYRGLLDVLVSSVDDSFAAALGVAVERHFLENRVSPYFGGSLTLEMARSITDEAFTDTRTNRFSMPVSAEAIAGVELFVTRLVSVFAEYSLSVTVSPTWVTETVAGVENKRTEVDWSLDMGLGNQSKVGVVVYFITRRDLHLPAWSSSQPAPRPQR